MHQPRTQLYSFIGGVFALGLVGSSLAGLPSEPEDEPIEWVEIEIHMADGRVIKRLEHRYPSRSRVYLSTGKLPAFNQKAADGMTGSELAAAAEELGESVEDAGLVEELGPEIVVENDSVDIAESTEDYDESGPVKIFKKSS